MPRTISVKRKYLPALSREVSLLSSHRSFRGSRKPCGGGPAGVAERKADVEKRAAEYGLLILGEQESGFGKGRPCIRLIKDLVDPIVNRGSK